ncbi:MAG TPA: D-2-hydroxyacid dehydrogenase [Abditibacteriaceae bacterium]
MSKRALTIYCNAALDEDLLSLLAHETSGHHLVTDGALCSECDIAFGQPDPAQVISSSRLQWIHLTSAGYTRYDTPELRAALQARDAVLTNSSHVFDAPCAQHILATMLADARQLPQCYESQCSDHAWKSSARREASYLLNGQTVLLLGMGAIAQHLIQLLRPFEMNIIAVRRSAQLEADIEVVGESMLEQVLPRADHVVNVLPESPSTLDFMNAVRFEKMKPLAKFYNVGRGKTVDQEALLGVLKSGHLGAAYLDVTDPEPLPPDHSLWTAPRCVITPHCAGGHKGEGKRLVEHFVRNLRSFEAGAPLTDLVEGSA